MPNIVHRLSIDAPPEGVHELAATKEGIQQWWTPHPVAGDDSVGGTTVASRCRSATKTGSRRTSG